MCKFNQTRFALAFIFVSLTVLLNGCSSDGEERPEYLDATTFKGLEIPPKLTTPDTSGALQLPEPSKKAVEASAEFQNSLSAIAPEFKSIKLKNDGRLYWLEIEAPVEAVWAGLPNFLSSEGIAVARVEKLLGFVDTEWMNEYKITYAGAEEDSSWFSGFTPDYKDKFRLRVEAIADENKTRLFVSHRGVQIVVTDDASGWAQRASEPLLEREIMYRYMLYAGVNKGGATDLLAEYRSYQPRVKASDSLSQFEVQGDRDTVWLRLKIAMDRLGVTMEQTDRVNGRIEVLVGSLKTVEKHEEDSGWFGGWFGGDVSVDDDSDYETPEYKEKKVAEEDKISISVQQIASDHSSIIKLVRKDGGDIDDDISQTFREALIEQLK